MRSVRELPLVWFVLGSALGLLCIAGISTLPADRRPAVLRRLALAAGLFTLIFFVGLTLASLQSYMLLYDEADILSIAAASTHGQPVYHSLQSLEYTYSMPYGPYTSIIYGVVLLLGKGSFLVLRCVNVAAVLLACLVAYDLFHRFVGWERALAMMALPLSMLLQHGAVFFGLRPDLWLFLALLIAVRATLLRSQLVAALLAGICVGVAIDLKASALVASALVVMILYRRGGPRLGAIGMAAGAAAALAPFALPNVSALNYIAFLRATRSEGIEHSMLTACIMYALFFVLPLIVLKCAGVDPFPAKAGKRPVLTVVLFACCVLAVVSVAAKPGAGPWHFWQLIPVLAIYVAAALGHAQATQPEKVDKAVLIIACGSAMVALAYAQRDIAVFRSKPLEKTQVRLGTQEIDQYMDLYRGPLYRSATAKSRMKRFQPFATSPSFADSHTRWTAVGNWSSTRRYSRLGSSTR